MKHIKNLKELHGIRKVAAIAGIISVAMTALGASGLLLKNYVIPHAFAADTHEEMLEQDRQAKISSDLKDTKLAKELVLIRLERTEEKLEMAQEASAPVPFSVSRNYASLIKEYDSLEKSEDRLECKLTEVDNECDSDP